MLDFNKIKEECDVIVDQVVKEEVTIMEEEGFKLVFYNTTPEMGDKVYDECGGASIIISDMRSIFGKQYKKFMKNTNEYFNCSSFHLYKSSQRQEMRVNLAVANAISQFINKKYNANSYVREYLC